ncbi:hypothetical protein HPP92_025096 [Vanilla planifolia]|uniref:SET domain-containing protein n=1 Tax=Vanilla planifolia TaxID=51239 RepID=A0A835PPD2_VANPL|nr:hypothetical protein HPP92_025368 [Vanilla planifolia]KAG0453792.1 hypothetical protein HPP92_025096 [Vanilla planifolia]
MAAPQEDDAKLQLFLQWLQANGCQLRCCTIKNCGPDKGFGVFSSSSDGVAMVVPLDLAITPMRVLQDPFVGERCRALFEEGDVDDRFLIMLFLTVERLRRGSLWKPYLDMLPESFGNPLWFTEDELAELNGTTLYRASVLQWKNLQALYNDKVKVLVAELLPGDKSIREVKYEDFLWANSIFWSRALSIPFPRSYVFPEHLEQQEINPVCHNGVFGSPMIDTSSETTDDRLNVRHKETKDAVDMESSDENLNSKSAETVWVEGLVPGIDFCNHGLEPMATWEVDQTGSTTGAPFSMYLMLAFPENLEVHKEINISYGNKGNEELLYLYGFVIDNNPSDFLMVHYPTEAFQNSSSSEAKEKLLMLQKAELRCLLPKSLLHNGFFGDCNEKDNSRLHNSFSWSGQRKVPSYLHKLIFPQEFIAALRTVSMKDNELTQATSLLEDLVESRKDRQASEAEVQAAVWESCGDYAALELLVDLLRIKMLELEEGSGTEQNDAKILEDFCNLELEWKLRNKLDDKKSMTRNRRSCVVYRRGRSNLHACSCKKLNMP